jgi:predicted permease
MRADPLHDGWRSLAHDRRFSAAVVSLLAVAIGAVTAVYAIAAAVVMRPFPFTAPDRIVVIWQTDTHRGVPVVEIAYGEMTDWRARSRSFAAMAVVGSVNWSLTLAGTVPEQVPMAAVSSSFFDVVGTPPLVGHAFHASDDEGRTPRRMVISYGLWTRRFGRDPAVIGRAVDVRFDAGNPPVPVEITGVMPREFDYPRQADAWMPAAPLIRGSASGGVESAMSGLRVFFVLGRLRDGVSRANATRELTQVMRSADLPGFDPPEAVSLTPVARYLLGPAEPVLWALLAGAVLMLVIACANVAGLQVSRAVRRERALSIRVALGASDGDLVASSLAETMLLTAAALGGAIAVAFVVLHGLLSMAPAGVPRIDGVRLFSLPVLAWCAAVTLGTLVLCGVWPALRARRVDAVRVLAHGTAFTIDRHGRRVQRAIVIAQIGVAVMLLTGMGLFVRMVRGLDRAVLGFDPSHLVVANVTPANHDLARWNAFYDALLARLEALPDVEGVGAMSLRPLSGPIGWDTRPIYPEQNPRDPRTLAGNPYLNLEVVTPGYFKSMGIRLVEGRLFSAADRATTPGVVIVSDRAARRIWPGRSAVGQRLFDGPSADAAAGGPIPWQTVIGVVDTVRYRGLDDIRFDLYRPAAQADIGVQQIVVRTRLAPGAAAAAVRAVAVSIDPAARVSDMVRMDDVVAAESAPWRFLMRVFLGFAVLAGSLAVVGLGAVVALTAGARRRELAIRAALGADRTRLRLLMLRDALPMLAAGIGLGVLGSVALGRTVQPALVGVLPLDPLALSSAFVAAAAAGLLAIWVPAARAARADPLESLRQ